MIIRNKFKKIPKERLSVIIIQDLKLLMNLNSDKLKLYFPYFKSDNLDKIKSRFIKDIEKIFNEFDSITQNDINTIISEG